MAGLAIETDNSGWQGTFTLTVGFAAADVLSDGAPVDDVRARLRDGTVLAGTLTAAGNGQLVIDSRAVDIELEVEGFYID
jgi:hypothetical protein